MISLFDRVCGFAHTLLLSDNNENSIVNSNTIFPESMVECKYSIRSMYIYE